MKIQGRVWKFGDNINTDMMYPSESHRLELKEQMQICFRAIRPEWKDLVQPGDIIVAGTNYGTGSGRDCARVLQGFELGGLIAESINGLFFRNCVNHGLPAMECPGVPELFEEGDIAEFDLETGIVTNLTTGKSIQGTKLPPTLARKIMAGGNIAYLIEHGYFA